MELVQTAFQDGVLLDEATCKAVALILKRGGDYCGICIVEVVWKLVTVTLNLRFTTSIIYHDPLHGFRVGHGTGNATLEVKLLQQVTSMRVALLHAILLDLQNTSNALDRSRYLAILKGYVMRPRALRLFRRY